MARQGDSVNEVAAGTTIYREGEPAETVYLLRAGTVSLHQAVPDGEVELARLEKGAIFGEMAVLLRRNRSVTARAAEACTLLKVDGRTFLKTLGRANSMAVPLLTALARRLDQANHDVAVLRPYGEGAPRQQVRRITVTIKFTSLQREAGVGEVVVPALPFVVGRCRSDEKPGATRDGLKLPAKPDVPADLQPLAERHFVIDSLDGQLVIMDLYTPQGTVANEVALSRYRHAGTCGLRFGNNPVIAGNASSPYQVGIFVER